MRRIASVLLALLPSLALAQTHALPPLDEILPPNIPWSGKSESIVVPANDPWITPSEASGLATSPSYDETVAWLRKLVAAAPQLRMVSLGKSPEGRDIWMVIASKERRFTPEALRASGKPTL
ncbi:MAG TPA: M14 family zinc carboxypeptidase, partial [Thermoanaerobaculia bacterium]